MLRPLLALRLLALALALMGAVGLAIAAPPAGVLVLHSAEALVLDAPTPAPPGAGAWRTVTLPDDWTERRTHGAQVNWYRLGFEMPAPHPSGLWAAYVPRACANLELYLNGRLLHRSGRMHEPAIRNCYQSQLVVLPPGVLQQPGVNRLDIQVSGFPLPRVAARQRAGGLSGVWIGPYEILAAEHESQRFWNVTLAQTVAAILALMGGLMLALAWVRRMDYLLYLGIASVGWAALTARLWWREAPLRHDALEMLTAMAVVPLAVCGTLFVLRYAGVRRRAVDLLLWLQCVVLPAGLAVLAPDRLFEGAAACYTLLAAELLAAFAVYFVRARGERAPDDDGPWLMGSIFAAAAVAVAVEVAIQNRLLELPHVHVLHFAVPLVLCALGLKLVRSFGRALSSAEQARGQLERRVEEISAEIERNFSHLAEVRVEQVAEKERKRIAADLHDDLGAKLLTIVHTSDNERISTLAREALEEMRLSVRGIAGKPVQLADALADWRAETVSRLGDAGIEVEWQSEDPHGPRTLAARSYVQTTRVLREATSNLIKHSGASRAVVSCTVGDDDFQLVIRDNGRGIPLELDGKLDRGHGMASMKQRAKQMQGQCLVESGPGYGTVIRLTLPL